MRPNWYFYDALLTIIFKQQTRLRIMISSRELFAFIPRKVENWSEEDVKRWFELNAISLNSDIQFKKEGFNGPALLKATPQFLCNKCGLNKVIMMKVIEWIQYERQEFEELVSDALQQMKEYQTRRSIEPTNSNSRMNINQLQKQEEPPEVVIDLNDFATEKNKENNIRNSQKSIQLYSEAIQPLQNVKKWKKKEPLQKQLKKSQKEAEEDSKERQQVSSNRVELPSGVKIAQSSYEILQKILVFEYKGMISTLANHGKIGRNITNDVIFIEESISREHARVFKQQGQYFIMDNESKFGTFVEIGYGNRKKVNEGDIIAIQDGEFQIVKYKFTRKTQTFDLKIKKFTKESEEIIDFSRRKMITIGSYKADITYQLEFIRPHHAKLICDRSGLLTIVQQGGRCFRKLNKDQLFKLDCDSQRIRLGNAMITTKLKCDYKPFQMISAFQLPEEN